MSIYAIALSLLTTQTSSVPAFSDEAQSSATVRADPFDREYAECQRTAPPQLQTSGDLYRQCGAEWRIRAVKKMGQELVTTLSRLATRRAKEALTEEQRSFETAMVARCAEYTPEEYGQMGPDLDWFVCEARLIDARIAYLRAFANGRGDETPYN